MNFKLKNANGEEQIFNNVSTLQVTKTDNSIGYFDERQEPTPTGEVHLKDDYLKTINDVDSDIIQNATTLRFSKTASDIAGATKIETTSLGTDGDIFAYKNGTNLIIYSTSTILAFEPTVSEEDGLTIRTPLCWVELNEDIEGEQLFLNSLQSIYLDNFSCIDITSMFYMFADLSVLIGPTGKPTYSSISFSPDIHTENVTDIMHLFQSARNLTTINGLEYIETLNILRFQAMFEGAGLHIIDVSSFKLDNANDVSNMFSSCYDLTTIYVSQENSDWTNLSVNGEHLFAGSARLPNYDPANVSLTKAKLSTDGGCFTLKEAN